MGSMPESDNIAFVRSKERDKAKKNNVEQESRRTCKCFGYTTNFLIYGPTWHMHFSTVLL